jgi:hypothetical protein
MSQYGGKLHYGYYGLFFAEELSNFEQACRFFVNSYPFTCPARGIEILYLLERTATPQVSSARLL